MIRYRDWIITRPLLGGRPAVAACSRSVDAKDRAGIPVVGGVCERHGDGQRGGSKLWIHLGIVGWQWKLGISEAALRLHILPPRHLINPPGSQSSQSAHSPGILARCNFLLDRDRSGVAQEQMIGHAVAGTSIPCSSRKAGQ